MLSLPASQVADQSGIPAGSSHITNFQAVALPHHRRIVKRPVLNPQPFQFVSAGVAPQPSGAAGSSAVQDAPHDGRIEALERTLSYLKVSNRESEQKQKDLSNELAQTKDRLLRHEAEIGQMRGENLSTMSTAALFALEGRLHDSLRSVHEEMQRRRLHLECVVCLNERVSILFTPCGHLSTCQNCAAKVGETCPVCMRPIETKIRAYI